MTPEEVDQLAGLCSDATMTETGKRLYAAIITDGLFESIIGDHPDPGSLAGELGNQKITQLARQELEQLSEPEREELAEQAADHLRKLLVSVAKPGFKAMKNGIITSDQLTPEFLAVAASAVCVANATK